MAYYKFRDGTTSLEAKENFELLSNSNLFWIGIGVLFVLIIFLIFYLKKRNVNKQTFGFRFY